MNYELAKQLKDAGFPFKYVGISNVPKDNGVVFIDRQEAYEYPTLSELIEACGEDFRCLIKDGKDGWCVQGDNFQWKDKTPEEAVAKLWLELNKK
jgi:hypothetical protein